MRYRQRNLREENPEAFAQLVKNNPYMARVYDFPELLIPHPTPENFHKLWTNVIKETSGAILSRKIHLNLQSESTVFFRWKGRTRNACFLHRHGRPVQRLLIPCPCEPRRLPRKESWGLAWWTGTRTGRQNRVRCPEPGCVLPVVAMLLQIAGSSHGNQ